MKKLIWLLAALAITVPLMEASDSDVVCTETPESQTTCSATDGSVTVTVVCTCNPNPTPTPTPTPAPSSLLTGLVSVWPLEADGTDSVGSNDLTNNNGVTFVAKGVGAPANLPDNVANFVAASNQSFTRAGDLGLDWNADLSVVVWFKSDATGSAYELFSVGGDGFRSYYASGTQFQWYLGGSPRTFVNGFDTNWHLMVLTQTDAGGGTFTYKYSFDGAAATTIVFTGGYADATSLSVGKYGGGALNFFDGLMSSLLLYSRAIDDTEIACLYAAGDAVQYPFTGVCN